MEVDQLIMINAWISLKQGNDEDDVIYIRRFQEIHDAVVSLDLSIEIMIKYIYFSFLKAICSSPLATFALKEKSDIDLNSIYESIRTRKTVLACSSTATSSVYPRSDVQMLAQSSFDHEENFQNRNSSTGLHRCLKNKGKGGAAKSSIQY